MARPQSTLSDDPLDVRSQRLRKKRARYAARSEEAVAADFAYRANNRARRQAAQVAYRVANAERVAAYREITRDKVRTATRPATKTCSRCHVAKSIDAFCLTEQVRGRARCNPCKRVLENEARRKAEAAQPRPVFPDPCPGTKVCSSCHVEKPIEAFGRDLLALLGLKYSCKQCLAGRMKERIRRMAPPENRVIDLRTTQICSRCHIQKPASAFYRSRRCRPGFKSACKACDRARYVEPEHCREKRQRYRHKWTEIRKSRPMPELTVATHRCSSCLIEQPVEAFHRSKFANSGLLPGCKTCRRKRYLWDNFRMQPSDLEALVQEQHGLCEICHRSFGDSPVIDHDHRTGAVRALLCGPCNVFLHPIENQTFREAALVYLEHHKMAPVRFSASARNQKRCSRQLAARLARGNAGLHLGL